MTTFASLGLSPPLLAALDALGFVAPTPVQAAAIPAILRGADVLASAVTGSGKTAAFVLPIVERLAARRTGSPRPVRALVLAPTRELALQIGEVFVACGRGLAAPLKVCVAIGGVSINPQMMALRGGADVVVATPGRALDLVDKNALHLGATETLVLDEADRLLALGFADELARVLERLPAPRQNVLFSATFPAPVARLAEQLLRDPERIVTDAAANPDASFIAQRAIEVDAARRTMLLRHLLATHAWSRVLVFVASRYAAEHVATKLGRAGVRARPLHGELSQGTRSDALAEFASGRVRVLVATDVAARGLDFVALPCVVNYDLPRSAADFAHRVGRTGRAGERGVAISFVSVDTDAHFALIAKRNQLVLARERVEGFEPVDLTPSARDPHGGVKGRRKSKKDKLREAAAADGAKGDAAGATAAGPASSPSAPASRSGTR